MENKFTTRKKNKGFCWIIDVLQVKDSKYLVISEGHIWPSTKIRPNLIAFSDKKNNCGYNNDITIIYKYKLV